MDISFPIKWLRIGDHCDDDDGDEDDDTDNDDNNNTNLGLHVCGILAYIPVYNE